ncbi:MAG TPA: hypothetical protein PKM63_08515 [Panacibacter sp.]|nr:hypothetical protein [Panacibacter sp.]HNP44310.1 hypothetical protein [Panacibacter sp.]
MCVTIQKYQVAVNRFQLEIYPAVQYALEAINTIEAGVLDEQYISAVNNLQKEFHSLETFERKLIFPAVLSLFDENGKEKQFTPDIAEILNLCIAKEERLSTYVDEIKSMLEGETERESNTSIDPWHLRMQQLSDIFLNRFMPARQQWIRLLLQLESSGHAFKTSHGICTCGRYAADVEKEAPGKQQHQ